MECPYDKITLQIALITASKKFEEYEKANGEGYKDEIVNSLATENKSLNIAVAEHNGITVDQLINSPNYQLLKTEYMNDLMLKFMSSLKLKINLTDKEAWAILCIATGVLG